MSWPATIDSDDRRQWPAFQGRSRLGTAVVGHARPICAGEWHNSICRSRDMLGGRMPVHRCAAAAAAGGWRNAS